MRTRAWRLLVWVRVGVRGDLHCTRHVRHRNAIMCMFTCVCFFPASAICRLVFATVSAARIRVRSDADASATCGHESLNCRTVQEALAIASLDGTEIDVISPSVRASSDASDARSLQICDFRALLLEVSKD